MKKILVAICSVIFLLGAGIASASAADLRVAVVDMPKLLKESPQVAKIDARLKKKFTPQETKILNAQKKLKADVEKLQRDASVSKASARKKEQDRLIKEQKDFQALQVKFMQEVSAAHSDELKKLLEEINVIVIKVAKDQKLDLVLQAQSVLYVQDKVDITNAVLAKMKK